MLPTAYRTPRWLLGGNTQTIYPALFIKIAPPPFRRERWNTPDGDFIDVDFVDGQADKPFFVLFHGLEGSSDSHYCKALMNHIAALGWSGAIPHFRGCSGEVNLAPRSYHSGDTAELDWILRRIKVLTEQRGAHPIYAAGVSLGGNALLRWLGEFQHQAEFIDAACAISTPLDLYAAGTTLGRGFNMIYTRSFLKTLKPKAAQKLKQFPGLFDLDAMLASRNLYEYDNVVTAPLHGFRDADDYWHRASSHHVLDDITVPTLVLNAKNDPFLPHVYLPQSASRAVTLEYPDHGGHVGFVSGAFPGNLNWLPQRATSFLQGTACA